MTHKLCVWIIMFVVFATFASAYPGITTTWASGNSILNFSYPLGGGNESDGLNLALGSDILNGVFTIKPYITLGNYEVENASYWVSGGIVNSSYADDNDLTTFASFAVGTAYIVYDFDLSDTYQNNYTFSWKQHSLSGNAWSIISCEYPNNDSNATLTGVIAAPYAPTNYTILPVEDCFNSVDENITIRVTLNSIISQTVRLYEVWMNTTGAAIYPSEIEVFVNNQQAYVNTGTLNTNVQVNMTNYLNPITTYPTSVDFVTNNTGIFAVTDLYVEDTIRNFTFTFYNEYNGTYFPLNLSNTTLSIVCPETSYNYDVTSSTYLVGVDCESFDEVKVVVDQEGYSYFRTILVPPSAGTSPVVDWYLVDLHHQQAVQIIINLDDRSGYRWAGSAVKITKNVNNTNDAIIVEQNFDMDNKVYLYLMKDTLYDITVTNNYGETWTGQFVAAEAAEKTIVLPELGFYPNTQYGEDDISLQWDYNFTQGWINVTYYDLGDRTTFANFTVYNATNMQVVHTSDYTGSFVSGKVFYADNALILTNQSYVGVFWYYHADLGWIENRRSLGQYENTVEHTGWTTDQFGRMQKWFTFLFLIILILSFSQKTAHIGLVACFIFMAIFYKMGWLGWVTGPVLAIIGVIAVYNWYRTEEVMPG